MAVRASALTAPAASLTFSRPHDCHATNTTALRHAVMAVTDAMIGTELVLPLHEEMVSVDRRETVTGTVQVHLHTSIREQLVDEDLARNTVVVDRVAVGRVIDSIPAIREEGDLTIIPVVEEVLVVEKRLLLKEEIHVRRVRVNERHRETVSLREQDVTIERKTAG